MTFPAPSGSSSLAPPSYRNSMEPGEFLAWSPLEHPCLVLLTPCPMPSSESTPHGAPLPQAVPQPPQPQASESSGGRSQKEHCRAAPCLTGPRFPLCILVIAQTPDAVNLRSPGPTDLDSSSESHGERQASLYLGETESIPKPDRPKPASSA